MSSSLTDDDNKYEKRNRQERKKALTIGAIVVGLVALLILFTWRWNASSTSGDVADDGFKVIRHEKHDKDARNAIVEDLINMRLDELQRQQQFDHMPADYDESFGDGTMAKEATKRFKEQVERARSSHQRSRDASAARVLEDSHRYVLPERGNLPRRHVVE